ncbi:MAG: histidine kinase dimerization/phospho-acceptor domain-containing protein [Rubripirellula sp.]|nr:histidine kinase dimerization/phospho-acceptor domain-containing protein [Rubripirellula sp.]
MGNGSREFRTPLTVVKECISWIREGMLGQVNNEQARFVRIAEDRADDLNTMGDDMLDISKLEAGILATHRRSNEFHDITRQIFPSLQRKAEI